MKRNLRLYFENPIDEIELQTMLDKEFDDGEIDILKIDDDRRGVRYALISAPSSIPDGVFKVMGDKRNAVTAVQKESNDIERVLVNIEEDFEIPGTDTVVRAGETIEILY